MAIGHPVHCRHLRQHKQPNASAEVVGADPVQGSSGTNRTTVAIAVVCVVLILALVMYGCYRMWKSGYGTAVLKPRYASRALVCI
jgi:hypothetical protein